MNDLEKDLINATKKTVTIDFNDAAFLTALLSDYVQRYERVLTEEIKNYVQVLANKLAPTINC